jgi:hypothetical protein
MAGSRARRVGRRSLRLGRGDGTGMEEEEMEVGEKVLLQWEDFKAIYRGREKRDAGEVKRVGVICRSEW